MEEIIFCQDCLSKLEQAGCVCQIYKELCEHYCENGYVLVFEDYANGTLNTFLTYLENKGYIVTTDIVKAGTNFLQVMPTGYFLEDVAFLSEDIEIIRHTFCPRQCEKKRLIT